MSDTTTGEMLAWCNAMLLQLASRMDDIGANGGSIDDIDEVQTTLASSARFVNDCCSRAVSPSRRPLRGSA